VLGIGVNVAGECEIDDYSIQSSYVQLQQHVHVGRYSLIQNGCRIQKDVPPYVIMGGNPAAYHGINAFVLKHENVDERTLRHIANAYRLIYTGNFSLEDAVIKVNEQIPMSEEIEHIMSFIKNSKFGIVRNIKTED
jgi:UDP-N-acetylglucosamine acyltransferase